MQDVPSVQELSSFVGTPNDHTGPTAGGYNQDLAGV